LGHFA
jgi:hypothetical protein